MESVNKSFNRIDYDRLSAVFPKSPDKLPPIDAEIADLSSCLFRDMNKGLIEVNQEVKALSERVLDALVEDFPNWGYGTNWRTTASAIYDFFRSLINWCLGKPQAWGVSSPYRILRQLDDEQILECLARLRAKVLCYPDNLKEKRIEEFNNIQCILNAIDLEIKAKEKAADGAIFFIDSRDCFPSNKLADLRQEIELLLAEHSGSKIVLTEPEIDAIIQMLNVPGYKEKAENILSSLYQNLPGLINWTTPSIKQLFSELEVTSVRNKIAQAIPGVEAYLITRNTTWVFFKEKKEEREWDSIPQSFDATEKKRNSFKKSIQMTVPVDAKHHAKTS